MDIRRAGRLVVSWRCTSPADTSPRGRTRRGRPTVYDLLPSDATGLQAVGRLDLATSGLLLFTNDTRLAHALTDPAHAVARTYLATVRGALSDETAALLVDPGVVDRGERLQALTVAVRKRSGRETHLIVVLTEGRNREVRRMCSSVGHEVTRLTRVAFGGVELGDLRVGATRDVDPGQV